MASLESSEGLSRDPTGFGLREARSPGRFGGGEDRGAHILIADAEASSARQLERLFAQGGFRVTCVASGEATLEALKTWDVDLLLVDLDLPGLGGLDLMRRVRESYADVPVVIISSSAGVAKSAEALRLGASDFIVKPFSAAAIRESLDSVLESTRVFMEIRRLRRELKNPWELGGLLSKSVEMRQAFDTLRRVAATDMTVVLNGESGAGEELLATALHCRGERRDGPFVVVNCAGFPDALLERELFGYEDGAFPGADHARPGKIELASGGTLFLNEIDAVPLSVQAKLLVALQNRKVQRLAAKGDISTDFRLVVASRTPLLELVEKGRMRRDFYYQVNVVSISLAPLRNRVEDIPLIVSDFICRHPEARRKGIAGISAAALKVLMEYHWPGNLQELRNVLERSVVMARGTTIDEVEIYGDPAPRGSRPLEIAEDAPLNRWLREQEKLYLISRLRAMRGRINLTAKSCGIDVKSLYRKMRFHGIEKNAFKPAAARGQARGKAPGSD
ncbi:MAG TPA: sigma-54 dependent transcriptional regulator [candidate division Zixibacteria bacterium]|nr:sigma-54 dependent transcriptional regulator [candidate division Zixibacteria bacterium]